jgi:hypothetical protein
MSGAHPVYMKTTFNAEAAEAQRTLGILGALGDLGGWLKLTHDRKA